MHLITIVVLWNWPQPQNIAPGHDISQQNIFVFVTTLNRNASH